MGAPKTIALLVLLGSTGLVTTEARAGLFGRCQTKGSEPTSQYYVYTHSGGSTYCSQQPTYAYTAPSAQPMYVYPSFQAPTRVMPSPQGYGDPMETVNYLLKIVTENQAFPVNVNGVERSFKLQLVPAQ